MTRSSKARNPPRHPWLPSGLVADADLDVAWGRAALTLFEQVAQADQEHGPLRTAVVHEVDRLLPVGVLEHDVRLAVLPDQAEGHLGADPFVRAAGALPLHELSGERLHDFHLAEAEIDDPPLPRVPARLGHPPAAQAADRRQGREDLVGAHTDSDTVENIRH